MPLISVVVPVYGVEGYIVNAIRSICMQTFTDYEIVLVDDESPDNSIVLAEEELRKHAVPFCIIRQENQGVSTARNTGIASAQGEWVICIDSDDEIHPRTLELLHNAIIANPKIEAFGVNLQGIETPGVKEHAEIDLGECKVYAHDQIINSFLQSKIKLFAPGLMISKKFLLEKNLCYRKDVRYSEDMLFVWSVLANATSFGYIDEKLYYYLKRPGSTMRSSEKEKILSGYYAFKELDHTYATQLETCSHLILPRWVLGTLHSVAKYMRFREFMDLAKEMDYLNNGKKLLAFPNGKIVLLAMIMLACPYIFYLILKKV